MPNLTDGEKVWLEACRGTLAEQALEAARRLLENQL